MCGSVWHTEETTPLFIRHRSVHACALSALSVDVCVCMLCGEWQPHKKATSPTQHVHTRTLYHTHTRADRLNEWGSCSCVSILAAPQHTASQLNNTQRAQQQHKTVFDGKTYTGFIDVADILRALLNIVNVRELTEENKEYRLRAAGTCCCVCDCDCVVCCCVFTCCVCVVCSLVLPCSLPPHTRTLNRPAAGAPAAALPQPSAGWRADIPR